MSFLHFQFTKLNEQTRKRKETDVKERKKRNRQQNITTKAEEFTVAAVAAAAEIA